LEKVDLSCSVVSFGSDGVGGRGNGRMRNYCDLEMQHWKTIDVNDSQNEQKKKNKHNEHRSLCEDADRHVDREKAHTECLKSKKMGCRWFSPFDDSLAEPERAFGINNGLVNHKTAIRTLFAGLSTETFFDTACDHSAVREQSSHISSQILTESPWRGFSLISQMVWCIKGFSSW